MRRLLPCLLSLSLVAPVFAQHLQTVAYTSAAPQQNKEVPMLHATANLVVVDVVVRDEHGNPIHGLKAEDFALLEKNAPQQIRNFEEHTAEEAIPTVAAPKLPPGVFTNIAPTVTGNGPLNILLIDKLNTAIEHQSRLRAELLRFIDTVKPGTRIAIFQLGDRLQLLQGFTDDRDLLRTALEKFQPSRPVLSDAMNTPRQSACDSGSGGGIKSGFGAGGADNFGGMSGPPQLTSEGFCLNHLWDRSRQRSNVSLQVMRALNAYVSALPGRKNLLWYSGNFPLYFLVAPGDPMKYPYADVSLSREFRALADTLVTNQISVYPIDARGLVVTQVSDVGGRLDSPSDFDRTVNRKEFGAMTGGRAFYNTNGMDGLTAAALADGANYYVLTYTPANTALNGDYREITVKLSGKRTAQLSYREGYFAIDPNQPVKTALFGKAKLPNDPRPGIMQQAMMPGAPPATQVAFDAYVTPSSAKPEKELVAGNEGSKDLKGPFQRYTVRFATDISTVHLTQAADGLRHGSLECLVYVYDRNTNLVNAASQTVSIDIKPAVYQQLLKSGLPIEFAISVPVHAPPQGGGYLLHLALHDMNNDHVGSLEVPVAALPPAVAAK